MRRAVQKLRSAVGASSFLRFLISGGVNTVATYTVYLLLIRVIGYKVGYTIAYVFGIALAFVINRVFVFRIHQGWRSMLLFPLVYLVQYLVSLLTLWIWVEQFHQAKELGPIIAVLVTVPLTFVLSRFVFQGRRSPA